MIDLNKVFLEILKKKIVLTQDKEEMKQPNGQKTIDLFDVWIMILPQIYQRL